MDKVHQQILDKANSIVAKPMPYSVAVSRDESDFPGYREFWALLDDWCKENCKGRASLGPTLPMKGLTTWTYFYSFERKEDAALFKLFWA